MSYYDANIDFTESRVKLVPKEISEFRSVHAFSTYVLPAHSETIIPGILKKKSVATVGLITARKDLQERYFIHGAAELVKVSYRILYQLGLSIRGQTL